ncbi:Bud site selection protein bud4, partial [Tulasnella sp. 403]
MEAIQSSRALRMSTSSQPSTPGKDDDIGNETFNSLNKSSELPWTRASPGRPERRRSDTAAEDVFLSTGLPSTDASHPPSRPNLTRVKSGKEVIKAHEAAIIAKRRELRQRNGSVKRPVKRRSLSTGDAEQVRKERKAALPDEAELLDVTVEAVDIPLTDSVDREIRKLFHEKQPSYLLREHEATIYATADKDKDKIAHVDRAGDVDSGKAWRRVQRPSDMNEYARQIKEFRESERPGKALGKVFVKVLAVKGINVPIPSQPTAFTITLNNGIHCVETPEARLAKDCRVDQEFELIEHGQLEFTLTIKVRKDPHILAMIQAAQPPPKQAPPPPPPPPMQKSSGLFARFSTPGKKSKTHKRAATQPEAVPRPPPAAPRSLEETIGHHLRSDGTLCQAFISFKDIAKRCDTRLFETSYPLAGHAMDVRGGSRVRSLTIPTRQVGEIVLQLFRLPPLHGVKPDQLPQSLEECHRGLRHVAWHKVTYHEGVLTQIGGDCSTWRRRHVKVIGSNLVSFNDVTNKPTATIELKMALAVVDDQDPASQSTVRRKKIREEGVYHVERSFRLLFPDDEEIAFFTDTDAEKARWLEILRALIGRIPPNPLWAEL